MRQDKHEEGQKLIDAIIYTKDDREYELLKDILLEEHNNAEVFRAELDGFTHYDRSYDIAVIALEGAAGMNEALEIKERFPDTKILWITSDEDFAQIAIRNHIYELIKRPYELDRLRKSIRKVVSLCLDRFLYKSDGKGDFTTSLQDLNREWMKEHPALS